MAERQRFEADLQKIEADIHASTVSGQEAAKQVQALVNGTEAARPTAMATDGAWEALISGPDPVEESGFLREALRAARTIPSSGPRPPNGQEGQMMTAEQAARLLQATLAMLPGNLGVPAGSYMPGPSNPNQDTTKAPTSEVQVGASLPPGFGPAPFPGSPSHPKVETAQAGMSGFPMTSPGSRPKTGNRVPVKGAPVHPVHTLRSGEGLAEKLDAKRQLERQRSALQPFGAAPRPPAQAPPQDKKGESSVMLAERSDEDLTEAEPGKGTPGEPGLDGMC